MNQAQIIQIVHEKNIYIDIKISWYTVHDTAFLYTFSRLSVFCLSCLGKEQNNSLSYRPTNSES